jgi:hypothetical protein
MAKAITLGRAESAWVYESPSLEAHVLEFPEFVSVVVHDPVTRITQGILIDVPFDEHRELIDNILSTFRFKIDAGDLSSMESFVEQLNYPVIEPSVPEDIEELPEELKELIREIP